MKKGFLRIMVLIIIVIATINGCSEPTLTSRPAIVSTSSTSPTPTIKTTPTPEPTATPTLEPTPTPTPIRKAMTEAEKVEYKKKFSTIPYKDLARNPDKYIVKLITFSGKVLQVMGHSDLQGENILNLRIATAKNGYDDVFLGMYDLPVGASRILEDDEITAWGAYAGVTSYEATSGTTITIPTIWIWNIEIK